MDSLTAAYNSGPSPGRGVRIKSRSVSKLSGKSMSIGGFMFLAPYGSSPVGILQRDAEVSLRFPVSAGAWLDIPYFSRLQLG